ncbi:MAG: TonB family protein [Chitinophagaceae bacterium]|nr:TonB family protein [Chitinophagaceae bacterium]
MRSTFLYSLLLAACTATVAYSQVVNPYYEIGYFTDRDKQPIDGYLDITYLPDSRQNLSFTLGETFSPGAYYDLRGIKISGRIMYGLSDGFFRFTPPSGAGKGEKITPKMCQSYTIGKDSFAVISDFTVERELLSIPISEAQFVEVVTTIGDMTFYQHAEPGQGRTLYTYIVRRGAEGKLVSFSKNRNKFKEMAPKYFKDSPYLITAIASETLTENDVLNMIKYLDYESKRAKQSKIYYSCAWEEIKDTSEYGYLYYADSLSLKGDTWSMTYFIKDGTPLYKASYNSLAPLKKEGIFTFYFPNGQWRKTVTYKDNEITGAIKTYRSNGQAHYVYEKKNDHKHIYSVVADESGKNLLDIEGAGTESFYDSIQKRQVTRVFKNFKLTDSYFIDASGNKVYQSCRNHAALYDMALEHSDAIQSVSYPVSAIGNNIHGMILLRLLVDAEGNTSKVILVKGLDYECDKVVKNYIQMKYRGKPWYPLKVDKSPVMEEILIAVVLEITPYSRYANNYYNNNMWHYQMMWNQQRMMTPLAPPTFH